jgi:hypothetical protein
MDQDYKLSLIAFALFRVFREKLNGVLFLTENTELNTDNLQNHNLWS